MVASRSTTPAAKRGLRCVALGSNNYLLARSETGGERATAMSSPIRTAEHNGLDPQGEPRNVLERIVDSITALTNC